MVEQVVNFPNPRPEDEQLRRLKQEAERLANQPEVERAYRIPRQAEALGVPPATLKATVGAILKERANRETAEQRKVLAEQRKQQRTEQEAERSRQKAEKEAEREKRRAEKEDERKAKEKVKAFATL